MMQAGGADDARNAHMNVYNEDVPREETEFMASVRRGSGNMTTTQGRDHACSAHADDGACVG